MAGYGLDPVRNADGGTVRANNFSDGNGYRIAATAPSACTAPSPDALKRTTVRANPLLLSSTMH